MSWIFQISKLSSAFLILLFIFLSGNKVGLRKGWASLSLFISLGTSSYSHLLSLANLFFADWNSFGRHKKMISIFLCFVLGYATLLGVCAAAMMQNSKNQAEVYQTLFGGSAWSIKGPVTVVSDSGINASSLSAALAYSFSVFGGDREPGSTEHSLLAMKLAAPGLAIMIYAKRIFFPVEASLPQHSSLGKSGFFWLCLLAGIFVLGLAFFFTLKRDLLLMSMCLTFLPASGFFFFSWLNISLVADRLVYVPFSLFVLVFCRWVQRFEYVMGRKVWALVLMALLYFSHERANYLEKVYSLPVKQFFPKIDSL